MMVAPSPKVRSLVLLRDGQACVSCGARTSPLEMQHRQRVGAGGSKVRPDAHELATACALCNMRFESDLQRQALAAGWKVRSWVPDPGQVPMFNKPRSAWGLLTPEGGVALLSPAAAVAQMREVYGPEWDRWADALPVGMQGRTTR
ncbi:HNH endonuclease [Microbacterium sp. NPDC058389]|uniref:HNH endonuclease n=1 Tax=Microbacterium sp. NPDC058389 TaxID=3346475 RepID=UPI00365591AA